MREVVFDKEGARKGRGHEGRARGKTKTKPNKTDTKKRIGSHDAFRCGKTGSWPWIVTTSSRREQKCAAVSNF